MATAQAAVKAAETELEHLEEIEGALADEADRVEHNLRSLHVWQAMSDLIVASPEYQELVKQHRDAWVRLRSIKSALKAVNEGLHNQISQRYGDEASILRAMWTKRFGKDVHFTFSKHFVPPHPR